MITRRAALLGGVAAAVAMQPTAWAQVVLTPTTPGRKPLLVPGKHSLYQRVITRPGATLSPKASAEGAKPVPGFLVYYVYARTAQWLEVGAASDGKTLGFVPVAKAIDWKHTMVGAFTNPAGRQPVLFLDSDADARKLILDPDPAAAVAKLRQGITSGQPGPVVATEPANFVDIDAPGSFYLLPILSAELIERETGAPVRLLDVLSVPSDEPPPSDQLKGFKASLVFLIDTTSSMQPYIDATHDAMVSVVQQIGSTALKDKFRFGVAAYRDSLLDTPLLEYPTKVFAKPDFSQPADTVVPILGTIKQATASSIGFDEDPIGGLQACLNDIDWTESSPNGGRYVLLITDAGARTADNPHSVTHMNIPEIKLQLDGSKIQPMVVHLLTPDGARANDHQKARAQYTELTRTNSAGSLYYGVPNGDRAAFQQTVTDLVTALLTQVAAATGVAVDTLRGTSHGPETENAARIRQQMAVVGEAMRLANLGHQQHTQAPDVQSSFTCDRDLSNADVAGLNVRVLLTRNQLADLYKSLKIILDTGLAGRIEPQTFFTQLRSAFATAATDPQQITQITNATNVGGMLGEYLDDLPYRSQILNVTQEDWLAMGSIAQREILNGIERRLLLFESFQEQSALWHDIAQSGQPGEAVYPVPIEALP